MKNNSQFLDRLFLGSFLKLKKKSKILNICFFLLFFFTLINFSFGQCTNANGTFVVDPINGPLFTLADGIAAAETAGGDATVSLVPGTYTDNEIGVSIAPASVTGNCIVIEGNGAVINATAASVGFLTLGGTNNSLQNLTLTCFNWPVGALNVTGTDFLISGLIADSNKSANFAEVSGATGIIENSTFSNNENGAMELIGGSNVTFNNVTFCCNDRNTEGGALFVSGASTAVFNGGSFQGNYTSSQGAAAVIRGDSNVTFNGTVFASNLSNQHAGGLYIDDGATVDINGGVFANNMATGSFEGGAIGVYGGSASLVTLTIDDVLFYGNSTGTAGDGGAIDHNNNNSTIINNSLFVNNYANDGSAIMVEGTSTANLDITNSTFTSNPGDDDIIQITTTTHDVDISNTIISGNSNAGTDITGTYTDGGGNTIGGTTTPADPDCNFNASEPGSEFLVDFPDIEAKACTNPDAPGVEFEDFPELGTCAVANCLAMADVPSGTNMTLCSTGGVLTGTDAAVDAGQADYSVLYLLVNSSNVIVDNNASAAALSAPAHTDAAATACAGLTAAEIFTVYTLEYETVQGITITNGTSTIIPGDANVFTDADTPDAYVDPATIEACMDLSLPGITVTVLPPIIVEPSITTTCAPDNLTYSTTFTVCGGSVTYASVSTTMGALDVTSGDNTTTFTVSGIPAGMTAAVTVTDNTAPTACTTAIAVNLASDACVVCVEPEGEITMGDPTDSEGDTDGTTITLCSGSTVPGLFSGVAVPSENGIVTSVDVSLAPNIVGVTTLANDIITSGTAIETGTLLNTGTTAETVVYTVCAYNFGPDGIDDMAMGDDCVAVPGDDDNGPTDAVLGTCVVYSVTILPATTSDITDGGELDEDADANPHTESICDGEIPAATLSLIGATGATVTVVSAGPTGNVTTSSTILMDGAAVETGALTGAGTITYTICPFNDGPNGTPEMGAGDDCVATVVNPEPPIDGSSNCVEHTVTVNALPVVTAGSNSPICEGADLLLTSDVGTAWNWTGPDGFTATTQNPTLPAATAAAAGTYFVTATDANGCEGTSMTDVVVNAVPMPVITPAGPFCTTDGAMQLVADVPGGMWSGIGVDAAGMFTPATAGAGAHVITYSVTVNGCVGMATTVVSVTVCGTNMPDIDISKNEEGPDSQTVATGSDVTFTINVENTGNEDLCNVVMTDAMCTTLSGPTGDAGVVGTMEVGEVWVYMCTVTAVSADFQNIASVTAQGCTSAIGVDDMDPSDVIVVDPSIDLSKNAEGPDSQTVAAGSDVTFAITVANDGTEDLCNVVLTDAMCDVITIPTGDLGTAGVLEIGEVWTYMCTVNNVTADFQNIASVTADGCETGSMEMDEDPSDVVVLTPMVDIAKNAEGPDSQTITTGSDVTFTILVTNTGNEDLCNVVMTDAMCTTLSGPTGDAGVAGTLETGEVWTYMCTIASVAGDLTNIASVTADGCSTGAPVEDEDPSSVMVSDPGTNPDIYLDKTGAYDGATGTINYTYVVTNTGDVTLTNVVINEIASSFTGTGPLPVPVYTAASSTMGSAEGTLLVGESATYTAVYTVTAEDYAAGFVDNQALAIGDDPNGDPVDDPSDDPTDLEDEDPNNDGNPDDPTEVPLPNIYLDKIGTYNEATGNIDYTYVVTNTGNVTLVNVVVTELVGSFTGTGPLPTPAYVAGSSTLGSAEGTLLVGESATYTASYPVTTDDLNAGFVDNQAMTTGDDPNGDPVDDLSDDPSDFTDDDPDNDGNPDDPTETPLPINPLINLEKSGAYDGATGTINYTYVVTNTGDVTLTNVVINEIASSFTGTGPLPVPVYTAGSSTMGSAEGTLLVGESATYTAVYTVTAEDYAAGFVDNQALAIGDDPNGDPVDDPSDDPSDFEDEDPNNDGNPDDPTEIPLPNISLAKVGAYDLNTGDITYTYVVTNTGNVTLTNVVVTELAGSFTGTGPLPAPMYVAGSSTLGSAEGTLLEGESATYTAIYTVTEADLTAGFVDNQAMTTGDDPNGDPVDDLSDDPSDFEDADPDGDGNPDDPTQVPLPDCPENADLSATKTSAYADANTDGNLNPGEVITYTIVLTNSATATADALNVQFTDAIPTGTTYVPGSTTTTQGTVTDNATGPASSLGTVAIGGSVTITFQVTVDNPFTNDPPLIMNQGVFTADNHGDVPTDDPNTPEFICDPTVDEVTPECSDANNGTWNH